MPGHKGRGPLGCEELDITEIAGADELYEAEGIIAQSEANATQLFGTARTYYSTEGSSQCIRAMLHLALQMRPTKADRPVLLAARNAHKALLYAAALLDFDIQWLWPAPDAAGALCTCHVEPEALASALDELAAEGRTPFGVYLTSPDYLGFVQDIAGLSAVCHAHGLPLLVDNAHGAYLHFLKEGSRHPIQLGADLCCDSAHKTLPVLTGGAYLHLGPSVQADEAAVRNALALFGSTSPSYLILQSLDAANAVLADSFRRQAGMDFVGRNGDFPAGDEGHEFFNGHVFLFSDNLHLRRDDAFAGSVHLCCVIHYKHPSYIKIILNAIKKARLAVLRR